MFKRATQLETAEMTDIIMNELRHDEKLKLVAKIANAESEEDFLNESQIGF